MVRAWWWRQAVARVVSRAGSTVGAVRGRVTVAWWRASVRWRSLVGRTCSSLVRAVSAVSAMPVTDWLAAVRRLTATATASSSVRSSGGGGGPGARREPPATPGGGGAGGQAVAAGDTGGGVDGVAKVAQALDVAAQGARGDLETAS